MKKNKLNQLKQTDGKLDKDVVKSTKPIVKEKRKIRNLDELWGEQVESKYGTDSLEEYTAKLEDMNLSDIQSHALTVAGLTPIDDRGRLIKRCVAAFNEHIGQFEPKPEVGAGNPKLKPDLRKWLAGES